MGSQHNHPGTDLRNATLRWLNDLADQGILTTDIHLSIVGWNRWMEQHSGQPAANVVGRHLFDVYPDLIERGIDTRYEHVLAGQVVVLSQRFHGYLFPMTPSIDRAPFTHMQQSVRIAPLISDDCIVGTITLIDDVTERVHREDELKRQIEELEMLQASLKEAIREREAFLSIASHELKTPLTGLLGNAHLMQRRAQRGEALPPTAQQSLNTIIAQAERLNMMVGSLLDVTRVQTGQLTVEQTPLDIVSLVQRIVGEQSVALTQHIVALQTPDEPVIVFGDEVRLTQVFNNLLNNAIKYSPAGGTITVQIATSGAEVHVAITDPGVGIPSHALPNLFQRFFRVAGQATRHTGGLGIGLYVVREIVSQHGGTISVDSVEDVGSTFTVHLPQASLVPRT